MAENGSLDETIQMDVSSSQPDQPAPESALGETVKTDSSLAATQLMTPAAAAPVDEAQPTVRVEAAPILETQPTVPMTPAVSPAQPVAPVPPVSGDPPPFVRRGSGFSLWPPTRWTFILAGAVGILLILACVAAGLLAQRTLQVGWFSTPTPTATPTPLPTRTPLPSPTPKPVTNTPVAPPTPVIVPATNTPRPAPTILGVGVLAKVTPPQGLKLKVRAAAGIAGQPLGELDNGTEVKIVEGPTTANDLKWWKIDNGKGLVGWSAEGAGGDTYLAPIGWAQ